MYEPRHFWGVTLSSTFTDLKDHRDALRKVIKQHGMTDVAMENDSAKLQSVIESSLRMVREGAAYIIILGHRYGQIPESATQNPNRLSITELEFNEALALNRPILLFIMDENHLVRKSDIDQDAEKQKKLDALKERAKRMADNDPVQRVYATFDSLNDFERKIGPSVAELHQRLHSTPQLPVAKVVNPPVDSIPLAPALYAEPPYIGSHQFVGRGAELDALNDWAREADKHTILLFEAIGGNGKSMLTWEWTTKYATTVRTDWAGIFWYSFYERGAVMADFCQRTMAYVTGKPLAEFRKKKTAELREDLLHELNARPYLFILDGLERVLVHYHRIDAAEVVDEAANNPTDIIANRDPCACIHTDDDDLLRSLAAASPSKLLVSSRLMPRVLFNKANQPIPGVQRTLLKGLRPGDAEQLFRACGVSGNAEAIQNYLTTNCDCHPLTIGVLAGLVNNYLPNRGNFDAWVADAQGGGQLNLAEVDLVQRRNHILKAALQALPDKSRQLLSTLALLSEPIGYTMLAALNPHLPPEPDEVPEPMKPELSYPYSWKYMDEAEKEEKQKVYSQKLERRQAYEESLAAWRKSAEYRNAPKKLADTVRDLELRGLLQYDHPTQRYDMHPVARGVAVGRLDPNEVGQYGQPAVDYFTAQTHNPYEQAESLDDVRDGINLVRLFLMMGEYNAAFDVYRGDLSYALLFNLEGYPETLSLIRPFFTDGWGNLSLEVEEQDGAYLANVAAIAFSSMGERQQALRLYKNSIAYNVASNNVVGLQTNLRNLSRDTGLAARERIIKLVVQLSNIEASEVNHFIGLLHLFINYIQSGQWDKADQTWVQLNPMGRDWDRALYRGGDTEYCYCELQFFTILLL